MALTKVTGQVINTSTDVTVGVLTVTNTLAVGGTVSIGGTLTYEDVTNIDSVGLITARNGIKVDSGNIRVGSGVTLSPDGDIFTTGISTFGGNVSIGNVTPGGNPAGKNVFLCIGDSDSGIVQDGDGNIEIFANDTEIVNFNAVDGSTFTGNITIPDKIVHAGDTDTAIRFSGADTITAETGGSERFRITSGGNVNIGGNYDETSHPLNVSDSTKPSLALHTGTALRADLSATSGICSIRSYANNPFTINIGGSGEIEALRILSDGKVGIGDDTPDALLSIKGDSNEASNPSIRLKDGTDTREAWITNTSGDLILANGGDDNTPHCYLKLMDGNLIQFATGNTERLRITSGGQVNIGNSLTQTSRLFTAENTLADGGEIAYIGNNDGASNYGGLIISAGETDRECRLESAWGNSFMTFYTVQDGVGSTEKIRITSDGAVGINQNNPNKAKLHVVSASSGSDEIVAKFKGGSGADCLAKIGLVAGYSDTANDLEAHCFIGAKRNGSGNTAHLAFQTYDGSSVGERVRITHNGKLRVGNSLNTDAAGNFQCVEESGADQANDCNAYFETNAGDWNIKTYYNKNGAHYHIVFVEQGTERGDIRGNDGSNVTYNSGSDYRWKENIVRMTGTEGIEICKKLQPSKYNWIENREITGQINTVDGFIAHEVVEAGVLGAVTGEKDAVKEDGSIDGQMLDYGQMTPVLTAAIKGLIEKVETLEAEVAALK